MKFKLLNIILWSYIQYPNFNQIFFSNIVILILMSIKWTKKKKKKREREHLDNSIIKWLFFLRFNRKQYCFSSTQGLF